MSHNQGTWTSKFTELIDHPTISIKRTSSKTHYSESVKNQRQRKNPKRSQKKKDCYFGRNSIWLSAETLQARRAWNGPCEGLKEKNGQQANLYSVKLFFR